MMRIGIFFGGPSREREIAFAGGRTVYDNLNKSLFKPIPLFIDSFRNIILLNWENIYKGSIRDFYPPAISLPTSSNNFQIYVESLPELTSLEWENLIGSVGKKIEYSELDQYIDFAFLSLHGEFGEDGQIQGMLESLAIPYSGSGIKACTLGMDKGFQKKLMQDAGFETKPFVTISRQNWEKQTQHLIYQKVKYDIGFPAVIRPANQGSSIGVSIVESEDFTSFKKNVDKAFFRYTLTKEEWTNSDQIETIRNLSDIRNGIGFPVFLKNSTIYHPEELLNRINREFESENEILIDSYWTENDVIVESFIHGKEFSCIVIRNEKGEAIALPPTEIIKGKEVFDYRAKYLPGLSRKETPINLSTENIRAICLECEKLFRYFDFNVYARIDGFIEEDGTIFLNDPNTTSGMLPSSFFFHQAAEIGLNPSQFLTYIIRTSIWERDKSRLYGKSLQPRLNRLDKEILKLRLSSSQRKKVGVIFGGYSYERHISVESGRNIFEKLASSDKYEPTPIFLIGDDFDHFFYHIPVNLLLKDNADDIKHRIESFLIDPASFHHPIIDEIRERCYGLMNKYASSNMVLEPSRIVYEDMGVLFDGIFIALHGRPGEDGTLQRELSRREIPYNGSNYASSQITINKFETLRILREHGFKTASQQLYSHVKWTKDPEGLIREITDRFDFPFIGKPVDDGCSSAVRVIKNESQLRTYLAGLFREHEQIDPVQRASLKIGPHEEFPKKDEVLIETLIESDGAELFMEITGGLLTHKKDTDIHFEIFEPSEALSGGEILSLEEKFLAGEGQNITPARLKTAKLSYETISQQVKSDFKKAAKILNVEGYARIDAFVRVYANGQVETIIIEVNSLPGMTPATCIFHQSALNGYRPYDFIDKILEFALNEPKVEKEFP